MTSQDMKIDNAHIPIFCIEWSMYNFEIQHMGAKFLEVDQL